MLSAVSSTIGCQLSLWEAFAARRVICLLASRASGARSFSLHTVSLGPRVLHLAFDGIEQFTDDSAIMCAMIERQAQTQYRRDQNLSLSHNRCRDDFSDAKGKGAATDRVKPSDRILAKGRNGE